MTKIVGALLARNEAAPDRYLSRVLNNVWSYCDEIVVVDDGSTDTTADVCRAADCRVIKRDGSGWWGTDGSEAPARERLWQAACDLARPDGWVYVFDADHELIGITPTELRTLLKGTLVDAWACVLWDCWDTDSTHRVDGFWQAWRSPRPWLFRALPGEFSSRDIHTGHAPLRDWTVGLMPQGVGIRHLGYVKATHRKAKAKKYLDLNRPVALVASNT